ncbi:MAG TPA: CvpA family protein [Gammaproteobacteria bacterium]|nr:CvpA family protein [Gammaproteobacteria bacterium]
MALNWVDYVIVAVFLISILGGFVRGGVREILSLLAWIAAFVVAGLFAKPVASYFASSHSATSAVSSASGGEVSSVAIGVSFAVLFFVTLIVGALIGYFANRMVEGGGVSVTNRLLGGIFGFGRGYLVNLLVIFIVQLTAVAEEDYWTKSSLVREFQPSVKWLNNKIEPGLESLKTRVGKTLESMTNGVENSLAEKPNRE